MSTLMRVISVRNLSSDEFYTRNEAARALNISERTFDRYYRDDKFEQNAINSGRRKIFKGDVINDRTKELIATGKFVEMNTSIKA